MPTPSFQEKNKPKRVALANPWDNSSVVEQAGTIPVRDVSQLIPSSYDYLDLTYTGDNLTQIVYKTGGSSGATVATITITYDVNNRIKTITKV